MIDNWLLAFNNIIGICYIKVSKNGKLKESKFYKKLGIFKIIVILGFMMMFNIYRDSRKQFLKKETILLTKYSEFSKIILGVAVGSFYIGGLILIFAQLFRRNRTLKLLQEVKDFKLNEETKLEFQKACSSRTIFNVLILSISTLIRNLKMLKNDYLPTYAMWMFSAQLFFITTFVLVFFWNFQQFILIALKEVKKNLQESLWNKDKFDESLTNLIKIENLLEYFEHNFGFQLTLISVNNIFSNINFVSSFLKI